jgi:hypothetical protein
MRTILPVILGHLSLVGNTTAPMPVILGHLSLMGNTTAPRRAACTPYSLSLDLVLAMIFPWFLHTKETRFKGVDKLYGR